MPHTGFVRGEGQCQPKGCAGHVGGDSGGRVCDGAGGGPRGEPGGAGGLGGDTESILRDAAEEKKFTIVPEPMLGFMRVDSEVVDLPEATILDIISATTKCMDSTKYCDADFLSLITILNALDMSPFIFFNDDSFCDIDEGEQNNLDKAVGE